MDTNLLSTLAHLSDDALLSRVTHLAAREREATAVLIAHLAELDERRLYLGKGCSSLFVYCTQVLHLSEYAAYGRIEAARTARRFPVILEWLEEGSVTLTTVGLLAAHLTQANYRELLDAARYQSKRQVEELVARLRPQPSVPASVRRLPAPRPGAIAMLPVGQVVAGANPEPVGAGTELKLSAGASDPSTLLTSALAATAIPKRPATIVPLAPERYKVQFTASTATCEKLRLAQALLRHQTPDGDVAAIFDRALTVLVQELTKQKLAATDRPRENSSTNARSRHIPAVVKRAAWERVGSSALSSAAPDGAAPSGGFWSSITLNPTRPEVRRLSRTSSSDVGRTTAMRPSGPLYARALQSRSQPQSFRTNGRWMRSAARVLVRAMDAVPALRRMRCLLYRFERRSVQSA